MKKTLTKTRWLIVALVFCLLAALVGLGFMIIRQNREARLEWLKKSVGIRDSELSRQILAGLIRDFPNDSEISEYWQVESINAEEERAREDDIKNKLIQLGEDDHSLKSRIGAVEYWLRQGNSDVGRELAALRQKLDMAEQVAGKGGANDGDTRQNQDFLALLLKEKPQEKKDGLSDIGRKMSMALDYADKKRWTEARATAADVLRQEPNYSKAASVWMYATVCDSPEISDKTIALIPAVEEILKTNPQDYYSLYSAGMIYQHSGNWTLAEDRYRRAVDANPASTEAKTGLVLVLLKVHKDAEARDLAYGLWSATKKDERFALLMWQALATDEEEARKKFLEEWGQSLSSSALPDLYWGDIAFGHNDYSSAVKYYQASFQKKDTQATLQKLADAEFSADAFAEAAKSYRLLLKSLDQNISYERNQYLRDADRLVRADAQGENWANTIADGVQLLESIPDSLAIRQQVGHAYLAIGESAKAESVLEPGVGKPDGISLVDDLFQSYWGLREYVKIKEKLKVFNGWSVNDDQKKCLQEWQKKLDTLQAKS
jgi:tetratricopeptide (TPR) repeat protein